MELLQDRDLGCCFFYSSSDEEQANLLHDKEERHLLYAIDGSSEKP
jgi:hypothetical protein